MNVSWPDILIAAILIIGAVKGLRRGFVSELFGAVALIVAIIAAFRYTGGWDDTVAQWTHLGPGSAHVLAMALFACAAYIIVTIIAMILGRFARLPLLGIGNAFLGACVGAAKATVLVWVLLYVALFFPLSRDLRADLHRSTLVRLLTTPNRHIDQSVRATLPWYVRPFAGGLFGRHDV